MTLFCFHSPDSVAATVSPVACSAQRDVLVVSVANSILFLEIVSCNAPQTFTVIMDLFRCYDRAINERNE